MCPSVPVITANLYFAGIQRCTRGQRKTWGSRAQGQSLSITFSSGPKKIMYKFKKWILKVWFRVEKSMMTMRVMRSQGEPGTRGSSGIRGLFGPGGNTGAAGAKGQKGLQGHTVSDSNTSHDELILCICIMCLEPFLYQVLCGAKKCIFYIELWLRKIILTRSEYVILSVWHSSK